MLGQHLAIQPMPTELREFQKLALGKEKMSTDYIAAQKRSGSRAEGRPDKYKLGHERMSYNKSQGYRTAQSMNRNGSPVPGHRVSLADMYN